MKTKFRLLENYEYNYEYFELNQYWDQFTGLHDKAGKEIFEGDIFRYTEHSRYGLKSYAGLVKYSVDEACFGYVKKNISIGRDVFFPFNIHDELRTDFLPFVEVIGNIHQTPELYDNQNQ